MATKTPPAFVEAGGREVRVSSPDRVIYEATERTPPITKLQVCEYFAAVGEPLVRAIGERPTAMERWPRATASIRRGSPRVPPTGSKR